MNGGWCEWVLDVARSGRAEGAAGERPLAPVDVPSSPPACHVPAACLRDQPPGPPSSARSVAYGVIAGLVSYVAIHTPFWVVDAVKKRWFPQDEGEDSPRFNRMQRRCAPGRGEAPDRWSRRGGGAGSCLCTAVLVNTARACPHDDPCRQELHVLYGRVGPRTAGVCLEPSLWHAQHDERCCRPSPGSD